MGEQATGGNLFVLVRVVLMLDVEPLLQAQVKDAAEFARKQGGVTASEAAEGRENAGNWVEGGLVNGDDRGCKGSKGFISIGSETLTKKVRNVGKEVLEWLCASSIKAFIDGLVTDGNTRIVPQAPRGKETPNGKAAGGAVEDTKEQGGPEEKGREDTWATLCRRGKVGGHEVSDEGL